MARRSTKENKNIYQLTREKLDLTREEASELLETISPERIEKIENERSLPYPDEVLIMSDKYKQPMLCNHYCANQCPIGKEYVPEIKIKDLSQIVLETIASLNAMQKKFNVKQLAEIEHQESSWGWFSLWIVWRKNIRTTAIGLREPVVEPEKKKAPAEKRRRFRRR